MQRKILPFFAQNQHFKLKFLPAVVGGGGGGQEICMHATEKCFTPLERAKQDASNAPNNTQVAPQVLLNRTWPSWWTLMPCQLFARSAILAVFNKFFKLRARDREVLYTVGKSKSRRFQRT